MYSINYTLSMRNWLLLTFSLLAVSCLFAQKHRYLSFELAGSGGFGSINYEKGFIEKPQFQLIGRVGFSLAPIDRNNGSALVFPVMVHAVVGKNGHGLDLAAGQTFSMTTHGAIFLRMPLALGYRYQPLEKHYYLRISYTPIVSYLVDLQWEHWGGLTFGYQF